MRSIRVLSLDYKALYDLVLTNKNLNMPYVDKVLKKYHDTIEENPNDVEVSDYSYLKVADIVCPVLKKNEILVYKFGQRQDKPLKSIYKEARFSQLEKGIRSCYITFGSVRYKEEDESYRAPLLLIPVDIVENRTISGYSIIAPEDEVIVNPTLAYYLKLNHGYTLPEFDIDDFDGYFANLVLPNGIELEMMSTLGIYSFLKMSMYNDLHYNTEEVMKNNNIVGLLDGEYQEAEGEDLELYPVVNCDSSQLNAIKLAASGKSFTLQGPPGSGKSQTITNIIATLIGNGKKVLFVSEKLAALQVVYNNLKKAGLAEFAIEIHSNKASKKEFIDEVYKTAVLPKYEVAKKSAEITAKHGALSYYLDEYTSSVHAEDEKGISLYDVIEEYLAIDAEAPKYKLNRNGIDKDALDHLYDAFSVYSTNMPKLGYDYRVLPYYGLKYTREDERYGSNEDLIYAISTAKKCVNYLKQADKVIERDNKFTLDDIRSLIDFKSFVKTLKDLTIFYDNEKRSKIEALIKEYDFLDKKIIGNNTAKTYIDGFTDLDLEAIKESLSKYKSIFKIFNKNYKNAKKALLSFRKCQCKDEALYLELNALIDYKKLFVKRNEVLDEYNTLTDIKIKDIIDIYKKVDSYPFKVKEYENIVNALEFEDIDLSKLDSYLAKFDTIIYDYTCDDIHSIESRLSDIYAHKDELSSFIVINDSINTIRKYNQKYFLDYYLDINGDLDYLANAYAKQYYLDEIYDRLDDKDILNNFISDKHNLKINDFKALDENIFKINRDIIISNISQKRPDDVLVDGSQFKILSREASKVRKQKSIVNLLAETFELVSTVKPVFLMSPLSVSTYLISKCGLFDCVIFDEASQIFASDAFGAIYRAKQCIIIGDDKQMPPSAFFQSQVEEDDDEEGDDDDLSILDLGLGALRSISLKWHYRSRSEELIEFSNNNFYNSTLITIPQAKRHKEGFGIDFKYVENGIYDAKTRTNMAEAELIADMVVEHYKNSLESLGVVAFSKVQSELISDLVEERAARDKEFYELLNKESEEPFFVKNLETVQGDERDRIIFSICYGYNADGKFYQRFGPLNNLGGERRLNVAITRAKYNICIVSSIKGIDIKDPESTGAIMLKNYLDFAENVSFRSDSNDSTDGLVFSVKQYIETLGYEVTTNYGASQFKIPLAVKRNGEYFMAVLLDNNDHKLGNTTDINRLYELLLNRLGWKYYKVFSCGWISNMEHEKNNLKLALEGDITVEDDGVNIDIPSFLEEAEVLTLNNIFPEYLELSTDYLKSLIVNDDVKIAVEELIRREGPIHLNYMKARLAEALGTKVTKTLENRILKAIPQDVIKDGMVYSLSYEEVHLRIGSSRALDEIPRVEIMDGIYTIVSKNSGIRKDDCYKELMRILGFKKVTDKAKSIFDDAVIFLKLDGKILADGDLLFI